MKKCCLSLLSAVCLLAVSFTALAAEPSASVPVQTQLKRVALFKNGLGFFVREGALAQDASAVLLGPFAAPSHGTFWVSCPGTAGLKSVISREVMVKEELPVRTFAELLRANVGREVVLGAPWEGNTLMGTVLSFTPDRPRGPQPTDPYAMGPPSREGQYSDGGPALMFFKGPLGVLVMDPSSYSRAQFASPDFATTFQREVRKLELEASFSQPKPGDWLSVSYLAKGITWAPSYVLDISDPKHARLTAAALIINEAEDLDAAHVDLVTGFPNLAFADVMSPIGRKEGLAAFLQALSRGRSEMGPAGVLANVMTQRASFGGSVERGMAGGEGDEYGGRAALPSYGAAAVGQAAEDLFLYPLEDVRLKKGETGYYPLFTESVPYTEFYQWEIPDYISGEERYAQPQTGAQPIPEIVWHSLRLTNNTTLPWTTAPAQIMNDGQIIGQDILNYTARKAETTVKITQALSVNAEQVEREIERQRQALHLYGSDFDRVTIQGTLRVTNYKETPVSLEIKKTVSGDVQSTTPQARDVVLARGLARMNPAHELTWTLNLKPGESQEITHTYQALIRR